MCDWEGGVWSGTTTSGVEYVVTYATQPRPPQDPDAGSPVPAGPVVPPPTLPPAQAWADSYTLPGEW